MRTADPLQEPNKVHQAPCWTASLRLDDAIRTWLYAGAQAGRQSSGHSWDPSPGASILTTLGGCVRSIRRHRHATSLALSDVGTEDKLLNAVELLPSRTWGITGTIAFIIECL